MTAEHKSLMLFCIYIYICMYIYIYYIYIHIHIYIYNRYIYQSNWVTVSMLWYWNCFGIWFDVDGKMYDDVLLSKIAWYSSIDSKIHERLGSSWANHLFLSMLCFGGCLVSFGFPGSVYIAFSDQKSRKSNELCCVVVIWFLSTPKSRCVVKCFQTSFWDIMIQIMTGP